MSHRHAESAIQIENLSKRYRIGLKEEIPDTLVSAMGDFVRRPFRNFRNLRRLSQFQEGNAEEEDVIWALKDVTFSVDRGEVIGIIGRNGAGKSTLLKILSRITEPSSGQAIINGRVASLLEVGTGFHPELTGRENVYLNGTILGMRKAEIDRKFDEIVAFAEVAKFIDTPVKRYSSGMQVRLAFAVAAHLDPEILIVDEVLAVGDFEFQKKCLGKMQDVAGGGRTVLFVSHNMAAVQSLCQRTILLNNGALIEDGTTEYVVSKYLGGIVAARREQIWNDPATAPGNEKIRLRRACIRPEHGAATEDITVRTPLVAEFEYWNLQPDAYLNLSVNLNNEQQVCVFVTTSLTEPVWHGHPFPVGLFYSQFHIPGDFLNDGLHRLTVLFVQNERNVIFHQTNVLVFDVLDAPDLRSSWHGKWIGAVRPLLPWCTERLADA
jgi:lipopolysaccharide transport system ATP-binding protein